MAELPPLARLTDASLTLGPIERLQEASRNIWYVLDDVGQVVDGLAHHWDVTPVHEAAHAVAHTLAGLPAGSLHYFPFGAINGVLGYYVAKGERKGRRVLVSAMIDQMGLDGSLKYLVGVYAGTVAEIRHDPRRAASGFQKDSRDAEALCHGLEDKGLADRHGIQAWAWAEACRMFQAPEVWCATTALADRLRGSKAIMARVSGPAIEKIVARHCPDGWAWTASPLAALSQ
ncbi:hypothetical protein [Kaistia granuli]|uniref:hypothetical protein n=1 Tax=Kaistia granuli TaxID=363259 RepID=UPI000376162F|nr:hypothetical protein [Kaistia granuli]